jgi:hypothetical protein
MHGSDAFAYRIVRTLFRSQTPLSPVLPGEVYQEYLQSQY